MVSEGDEVWGNVDRFVKERRTGRADQVVRKIASMAKEKHESSGGERQGRYVKNQN